jgi:hypothetical protein
MCSTILLSQNDDIFVFTPLFVANVTLNASVELHEFVQWAIFILRRMRNRLWLERWN